MKRVKLIPQRKDLKGQEWLLELDEEDIRVIGDADEIIAEFSREGAHPRFQFPSFWESRKNLIIGLKQGRQEEFKVSKKGVEILREYLRDALVDEGPAALRKVLHRALFMILGGVLLAIVGVVVSVLSYEAAARKAEGGTYNVLYGLVIAGVALVCKGIYNVVEYKRLVEKAQEKEEEDEDDEDDDRDARRSRRSDEDDRHEDDDDDHRDREDDRNRDDDRRSRRR